MSSRTLKPLLQMMRKSRRGGAAVETAIMMIFLVPTFMYVLFLQDLLWYKLEMQETIVSTPWDYAFLDWNRFKMKDTNEPPPDENDEESGDSSDEYDPTKTDEDPDDYSPPPLDNTVARNSRRTYCDHTSAYDGNVQYDCQDQHHHTNYAAHQCWLVGSGGGDGAKGLQVTCMRSKDSSLALPTASFNDDYNAGGIVKCYARLGVTNYFLPNEFFGWWGKNKVTKMKRFGGNNQVGSSGNQATHADAKGVTGKDGAAIIFSTQYFSVMHDPWAVNRPADIAPNDGGGLCDRDPDSRFRDRVKSYWTMPSVLGLAQAQMWNVNMVSDSLLSPASNCDGVGSLTIGDLLFSAPLAWKADPKRQFGGNNFGTSGWDDNRQQQAYNARQSNKTNYWARPANYY